MTGGHRNMFLWNVKRRTRISRSGLPGPFSLRCTPVFLFTRMIPCMRGRFVNVSPLVIVFIAVVVISFVGTEAYKFYADAKLQTFYTAGLFDECIAFLDKRLSRMVMTTFKQYTMRFMVYEAQGNKVAANRMLEHLLNMKGRGKQRAALLQTAFNYYAKTGNKKLAKDILVQLESSKDVSKAVLADCHMTYEIVFGKRCDMIDRMEGMLGAASAEARAKLYFLLSKQYANKGDRKQARRYEGLLHELTEAHRAPKPQGGAHAQ